MRGMLLFKIKDDVVDDSKPVVAFDIQLACLPVEKTGTYTVAITVSPESKRLKADGYAPCATIDDNWDVRFADWIPVDVQRVIVSKMAEFKATLNAN